MTNDKIGRGHVCEHGIRWPHACQPCDDAAWEREKGRRMTIPDLNELAGAVSRVCDLSVSMASASNTATLTSRFQREHAADLKTVLSEIERLTAERDEATTSRQAGSANQARYLRMLAKDQAEIATLRADLAAAREALERLERANDEVARCTTRERYLTDLADIQPALLDLDDARTAARKALSTGNQEGGA